MDALVTSINFFIHSANFVINVSFIVLKLLIMCWNICVPFIPFWVSMYLLQKLREYCNQQKREADISLEEALDLVFRTNVAAFRAESINLPTTPAAA